MGQSVCFSSNNCAIRVNQSESKFDAFRKTTDQQKLSLIVKISNIVRYSLNVLAQLLHKANIRLPFKTLSLGTGALKLFSVVLLPSTISKLAAGYLSEAKATMNEKIDIYLSRIETIGDLGDIIIKTVEVITLTSNQICANIGFKALSNVCKFIGVVTGPLTVACAILQGCGMILSTKNLIETHRFQVVFNKSAALKKPVENYALEDYAAAKKLIVASYIKEKSFIDKHFDTNSKKLLERLDAIEAVAKRMLVSENSQDVLEGKQKLQVTMQTLSSRLSLRKWSRSTSLLSGTISNIGFGLVYCPCPPVGFAMLAAAGGLSVANFFKDLDRTSQFEKAIGIREEEEVVVGA